MRKVCEWSGVPMWERCVGGFRWQEEKGGSIVRGQGRRGGNVIRWKFGKGGEGSEQRRCDEI